VKHISPLVIFLTLVAIGCENREEIVVYDAPKDPPPATAPVATMAMADAVAPHANVEGPLTWTLPEGWKQKAGGGDMRFATVQVSEDPPIDLTVIPLGGGASVGDVTANINRWEGQLGLPPTPAEKIDSVAKKSSPNGLTVTAVDLKGEKQRMLAAMTPHGGKTWFFKVVGPADVVEKHKEKFDAFVASLKPGGEAAAPAKPQAPAAKASMKLAGYKAADDWKEIPGSAGPRMIAFNVGPDEKKAELIVTRFGQNSAGGFLDNVNRWRGQIGLPPVEDMKTVAMSDTAAGDQPAVQLQFDNPDAGKRMLVAISVIGPDAWFFKLTGPPETLDKQKPAFEAFLKSLQFAPAQPEGDAK
jgi:hypothetical protein